MTDVFLDKAARAQLVDFMVFMQIERLMRVVLRYILAAIWAVPFEARLVVRQSSIVG